VSDNFSLQFFYPGNGEGTSPTNGTSHTADIVNQIDILGDGKSNVQFFMEFLGTIFPEFTSIQMITVSKLKFFYFTCPLEGADTKFLL
jgi:hypothetical protein